MKVNKIFSIDHELSYKLQQEGHQSQTVNKLLISHFKGTTTIKQTQDLINTKEQLLKDTQKEIKQLQPKLESLIKQSKKPRIIYS